MSCDSTTTNLGWVATILEKPRYGFVNYIYLISIGTAATAVGGGMAGVGTVSPGGVTAAGCGYVFPEKHCNMFIYKIFILLLQSSLKFHLDQ